MSDSILILTGGGETPVLNASIYGAVCEARKLGFKVLGGVGGWHSLMEKGNILDLTDKKIDGIEDYGGTFLKTSRTNPFKEKDGINQLKEKLKKHSIDSILAIGGDDTLTAAKKLHDEEGIDIVGLPKTTDNDLNGTYFSPGFPTAAHNQRQFVNRIKRDSAIPRSRVFFIESHGGSAGWLVSTAIFGQADMITVPEKQFDLDKFLEAVADTYRNNGGHAVVAVSKETNFNIDIGEQEAQIDSFQVKRTHNVASHLKRLLQERFNINAQPLAPGNYIRGGRPIPMEKKLGIELGKKAVELIKEKRFGHMANIIRKEGTKDLLVSSTHLKNAVGKENYRSLPLDYFDFKSYRPSAKFFEYMSPIMGEDAPKDQWYYDFLEELHS